METGACRSQVTYPACTGWAVTLSLCIPSALHSIALASSHCRRFVVTIPKMATRWECCSKRSVYLPLPVCLPFLKNLCVHLYFSLFLALLFLPFSLLFLSLLWDWNIYFLRSFWSPALNLKFNNIHQNSFSCPLTFSFFMDQCPE